MSYQSVILADSPMGYWRLGEVLGTTANDSSISNNDGTYTGTVTLGASTVIADGDPGLTLGGAGYVTMGDVGTYEFSPSLSVEYWIKHGATVAAEQAIIGKMSDDGKGYRATMLTTGKIRWLLQTSAPANLATLDTVGSYNDDRWHHVVHSWTGDTSANGVKTYVDGVLETQTTASAGALPTGLTDPFLIGAYGASFGLKWVGAIDDCAVYKDAPLTATQVAAHYAARLELLTSDYTVLVNSVDKTANTIRDSMDILDILNEAPNTASLIVERFAPTIGQSLEIKVVGTTVFKGTITGTTLLQTRSSTRARYRLDAMDGMYLLDRRLVNHDYASWMANSIAVHLINSFTTGFTTSAVANSLSTVDLPNKMERVSQALTRLANLDGGFWYLGYDNDLHFQRTQTLGDPQPLTSTKIFPYTDLHYTRTVPPTTRVYVEGQGTTTAAARPAGSTTLPILDDTPFNASGGTVISGSQTLTYTGLGTAASSDVTTWKAQTAISGVWQGVAWSPTLGIFVAVGTSGVAMSSPDGVTWTTRTAAEANNWNDVCWSPDLGIFCAVASNGTNRVMTSTNGTSWSPQAASEANGWSGVCWAPALTLFVAVSTTGTHRVMTSPDGVNWTNQTAAAALLWFKVDWSPTLSVFCAIAGDTGTTSLMTSANGTAWSTQTSASCVPKDVVWAEGLGLFVVACAANFLTSANGTTWALGTTTGVGTWQTIAWSEELGTLVAANGATASESDHLALSTDGLAWTVQQGAGSSADDWAGICWSAELGIFCAVASTNVAVKVMTSGGDLVPALTGIPVSGTGSIGTAIDAGADVNLLVTRNDTAAQTVLAALEGGDGIHEAYIQDRRLSETGANNRGDAELTLGSDPEDAITVISEDPFMISGRMLTVNVGSITSVTARIQQVGIRWPRDRKRPQRQVTATNVFKTLYQYLRDLDDRADNRRQT